MILVVLLKNIVYQFYGEIGSHRTNSRMFHLPNKLLTEILGWFMRTKLFTFGNMRCSMMYLHDEFRLKDMIMSLKFVVANPFKE